MPSVTPLSGRQPDFAQLRTALFCGQPDYVPALELFHDVEVKEAFLGRPLRTLADDIEFHYLAGYDCYGAWVNYRGLADAIAARLNKRKTVTDSPYDHVRERSWAPEQEALIKSLAELNEFPWPEPGADLTVAGHGLPPVPLRQGVREIVGALPPGMGLILMTDGIFERFTKDIMGYQAFCYTLADNPDLVARMFAKVGELWLALYEEASSLPGVDALWLADDIAYAQGLMFSPSVMRKYLFPWYRSIGKVAASHKQAFLFHSDGDLRPILPDLVACGIKAIQPIEPKAMDIAELKRDYAGRLCLVGNIDLSYTLTLGTPEDVRAEVRERLRTIGPGGGYCVGSSNSVTNYVPLVNFQAMLEATFEYGRYPLS